MEKPKALASIGPSKPSIQVPVSHGSDGLGFMERISI